MRRLRQVTRVAGMEASRAGQEPDIVVVMGVAGSGKTTVAKGIAVSMNWLFAEGDAFHPEANVEKMHSGIPLTDEDRWPWLRAHRRLDERAGERAGVSAVVTCSALRRVYRDLLREGRPAVRFCHMTPPEAEIADRLEHRAGHYMPPSLLPSQLATRSNRSSPTSPESRSPGTAAQTEVLDRVLHALGLTPPV